MRLTIDGRNVEAAEGMSILQAAKTVGIEIPTLCYLEGISDIGSCRLCVVEAALLQVTDLRYIMINGKTDYSLFCFLQ